MNPPRTPWPWRKLLAAVSVVEALLLLAAVRDGPSPHRDACEEIARTHARMERLLREYIRLGSGVVPAGDGPPADARALLDYHTRMRRKYEAAALHPGVPIPPDPPAPVLAPEPGRRP